MRLRISTKDAVRCVKPGKCKSKSIHRHHVRHQHLFVKAFFRSHPEKPEGGAKYDAFKRRYEEFREEDTEYLCDWHHAEIHYEYDEIIADHLRLRNVPLEDWTWKQAEALMTDFERRYRKWVEKKTRGRSPKRRWKDWYKSRRKK